METVIDQRELFPLLERVEPRRSAYREFMDAVEKYGPLMPQSYVPLVLDVSRARVSELIGDERIARVQVRKKWFVPVASLEAFRADERKNGRPVKELSLVESYRKHLFKRAKN
jgi:hypothetical protein